MRRLAIGLWTTILLLFIFMCGATIADPAFPGDVLSAALTVWHQRHQLYLVAKERLYEVINFLKMSCNLDIICDII